MLLWFIKPLRYLVGALRDVASPRRVAYGVALGMLVGLVPKDNLTAMFLGVVLVSLRVNLAAGTCSALLFTWVGSYTDKMADRFGYALLTLPDLQSQWTAWFQTPYGRWSGLDNTLVLGNLVLGLWLFYPTYRVTKLIAKGFADRYAGRIVERCQKYKLYQVLFGADLAASWRLN